MGGKEVDILLLLLWRNCSSRTPIYFVNRHGPCIVHNSFTIDTNIIRYLTLMIDKTDEASSRILYSLKYTFMKLFDVLNVCSPDKDLTKTIIFSDE